jgi:hypothetical protein
MLGLDGVEEPWNMLELVDADRCRTIGVHEKLEVRRDSAPGREVVEIQDLDPFGFGAGSQKRALADRAPVRTTTLANPRTATSSFPELLNLRSPHSRDRVSGRQLLSTSWPVSRHIRWGGCESCLVLAAYGRLTS